MRLPIITTGNERGDTNRESQKDKQRGHVINRTKKQSWLDLK